MIRSTLVFTFIFCLAFQNSWAQEAPKENPPKEEIKTPTPAELSAARQMGNDDGRPDGDREGDDRGPKDGKREGYQDGRDKGYRVCFDRQKDAATDAGTIDGRADGERIGDDDGYRRGDRDGEDEGEREGRADGDSRANNDSKIVAEPEGRRKGIEEAESEDAEARGYADGLIAGDARARETAQRIDYPRGRKDFYNESFAEAIQTTDAFAQKERLSFNSRSFGTAHSQLMAFVSSTPNEDCRYCNPRRSFKSPEEQQAYRDAYQSSYRSNFRSSYDRNFRDSYDRAYRDGKDDGCREAERKDYQRYYDDGRAKGYDEGYSTAYRRAYDRAHRRAYDSHFRTASDAAYALAYDSYYRLHYEAARRRAYQERTGQLYRTGLDRGDRERFDQIYPQYANEEYQRGRADEARDFEERPVRLLSAEATESIANGLFEPGEPLRLRVKLRNFSQNEVNAADVSLSVQALDSQGVIVSEPTSNLVRSLKAKSLTDISEALEFVLSESRLGRATRMLVSASYQGRPIGSLSIDLTARFLISVEFAERPKLLEGMPAKIRLKVTNQSPTTATGIFRVEALSQSKKIEFKDTDRSVDSLAVGASRIVEFTAIARTPEAVAQIPMAMLALDTGSRRVGALDFTGDVPLLNDYRITVDGSLKALRGTGITRVPYRIRNISSRLLFKGLQLKIRVIDTEESEVFEVLGRNPQYLTPLDNGDSLTFVFPILTRKINSGATLELEVQEDGRTTVIHRASFVGEN